MPEHQFLNPLEEDKRNKSRVLLIIRGVFVIMLVTVVMLSLLRELPTSGARDETVQWFVDWWPVALVVALFLGVSAILLDTLTPRKKLSSLVGILFGLIAGLLATVAISWIIDLLVQTHDILIVPGQAVWRIILAIKAAFAITLCYLGVAIVYSTQDEFRLIIPYVEFAKQMRGTRPLIMDTSAIIDGRMHDIGNTGFITAPVLLPRFVIDELQALGDSSDRLKRSRGRRGLDIVRKMQASPHLDFSIIDIPVRGVGVDQMLVELAREQRANLVTTDLNLNKVASIHGLKVLNINDLANALKPVAIAGERVTVEIVKRGEGEEQGVGYLPDGTMVVVERAAGRIGSTVTMVVTSSIQTSAGRMIFGESLLDSADGSPASAGLGESGSERSAGTANADSGPGNGSPSPPNDLSADEGSSRSGPRIDDPHGIARGPSRRNPRRL